MDKPPKRQADFDCYNGPMPRQPKKRITADDDCEIGSAAGTQFAYIVQDALRSAHNKTKNELKIAMDTQAREIKNDVNALKKGIDNGHTAATYVTKKHSDQASIIRTLNEELRAERAAKNRLAAENAELMRRLGREDAFMDCMHMMEPIMEGISEIRAKLRNVPME